MLQWIHPIGWLRCSSELVGLWEHFGMKVQTSPKTHYLCILFMMHYYYYFQLTSETESEKNNWNWILTQDRDVLFSLGWPWISHLRRAGKLESQNPSEATSTSKKTMHFTACCCILVGSKKNWLVAYMKLQQESKIYRLLKWPESPSSLPIQPGA